MSILESISPHVEEPTQFEIVHDGQTIARIMQGTFETEIYVLGESVYVAGVRDVVMRPGVSEVCRWMGSRWGYHSYTVYSVKEPNSGPIDGHGSIR